MYAGMLGCLEAGLPLSAYRCQQPSHPRVLGPLNPLFCIACMREKASKLAWIVVLTAFVKGGESLNTPDSVKRRSSKRTRARRRKDIPCACCHAITPFNWTCRCGFSICQACMHENVWGMSCNHITWQCPDCGEWNGFGNQ